MTPAAAVMVERAPERMYRVVGQDVVIPESETIRCPWCPRRGGCGSCHDSGRIVAYKPGRYGLDWPVAVRPLEEPSEGSR